MAQDRQDGTTDALNTTSHSKPSSSGKKLATRRRNPESTRIAILEAACTLLAKDGPEGLSVSQVAQLAGVNRGTAYQHFPTREQLLKAATEWVSENLCRAVFDDSRAAGDPLIDSRGVADDLAEFAMKNPELGRAWLFEMLSTSQPGSDPFWKQYRTRLAGFTKTPLAQPSIDIDVNAVLTLASAFLWPVWARAHEHTPKERREIGKRFSDELFRLSLHGTMRADKFPEIDARVSAPGSRRRRT